MVYTINLWYQIPASGASTFLYKIIVPILTEIPLFGQNVEKCGADATVLVMPYGGSTLPQIAE